MVFAIHQHESAMGVHVSHHHEPPSHFLPYIPLDCPRAPALGALLHASNLCWSPISHMVIYMLQRYSLISSHSRLLPQSPKACSLHLCLFCCLAYRVLLPSFKFHIYAFSSVQFSCSVVSDSFQPRESQHARPPCPSPTSGLHPNSCASNRWCHPAISSSVVPFSSCPQSLPASKVG